MKILKAGVDTDRFFKRVRAATRRALLLDYDGTLAPFRAERHEAFPYPGVPEVLNELLETGSTRIVLISGRATKDLVPLLSLERLRDLGFTRLGTFDARRHVRDVDDGRACAARLG